MRWDEAAVNALQWRCWYPFFVSGQSHDIQKLLANYGGGGGARAEMSCEEDAAQRSKKLAFS